MAADCKALARNRLAIADALYQAVTDDCMFVLACKRKGTLLDDQTVPERGGGRGSAGYKVEAHESHARALHADAARGLSYPILFITPDTTKRQPMASRQAVRGHQRLA